MAFSSTTILYIVELAFYLVLFPITLYLAYRHGRHGILGYLYVNIACAVRIVADIIDIAQRNYTGPPSLAAIVLGSIGLSPLLLALAGFLHETHRHILPVVASSLKAEKSAARWLWFGQWWIHSTCGLGMVLLIVGQVQLLHKTSPTQERVDDKLRSAGALILLLLWIALLQYNVYLVWSVRRLGTRIEDALRELCFWTLLPQLFIGVKVAYVTFYTFHHNDAAANPVTGVFAVRVVLVVGASLFAVIGMLLAGWKSRAMAQSRSRARPSSHGGGAYEGLLVQSV